MDPRIPPFISSFVIRFVVDSSSNGDVQSTYHGAIRHIQSDEELSFNSWEDAVDFIRRYVPLEAEPGQGNP
ncbi:MAG: hypothetical protein A2X25_13875 [Chloroflexi bacterium GWB2_49_20]|nr:MAG: hypothetical protein A2X25_13875 [Chloroflexi bacterium GWB2_49_20]OGN79937.1 MAG: hypothetical protein A2X26_02875 [Chloroflexi bacterium GWC2_49_37]OGN85528.1 MAG: hypothetical protein A2X27_04185 [Chloroflexi bacterium GWD2_49_16]HBG74402.1 hypothetical protein [Anaerolineae bacterium]HCM96988.1 hypothetical protein [Anaerolineae bacterium]